VRENKDKRMDGSLCGGIDWVGYVDWTVRDFHGYDTERGSSYNAYLIRDDQSALIDTVKAPFADDLLRNVAALTSLDKVNWVVCNHAEPDHAGALPQILAALPNATLVCNKKCRETLSHYFDTSAWKFHVVPPGGTLSLGARELTFIPTPFAHWPESMFTYVPQDRLLFSMDAFGQHLAAAQRFDDENNLDTVLEEAKTYYANILMPYGSAVAKAMTAAAAHEISMIAPAHGILWRSHVPRILDAYRRWTAGPPEPKVLVIYDSMWESTAEMARAIHDGALRPGVEVKIIHLRRTNLTRLATEVLDAAAVAFGSATLNAGMMPMAGAALTYLQGLKPAGKAGFAFGSSGWSRGGPEAIQEYLEGMKWNLIRPPLKAQYRPTPEILEQCRAAGVQLANSALIQGQTTNQAFSSGLV
jgi:flavorubredoxin